MITRRTIHGRFALRPTKKVTRLISYTFTAVAKHHRIGVVSCVAMSNHIHAQLIDDEARLSDFKRDFFSNVAKQIKHAFPGDDLEVVWSPTGGHESEGEMPEDGVAQTCYIVTNPIKHGVSRTIADYPGLVGRWPDRPKTFKKPRGFFQDPNPWYPGKKTKSGRDANPWPDKVTLKFVRPRGYEELSDAELALFLNEQVNEAAERARERWLATGRSFLGARAVRRQPRTTERPLPRRRRGQRRNTRVALRCSDPSRRIEKLGGIAVWRAQYDQAMRRWPTDRSVRFPLGTNKMKHVHNANVDVDELPT